MAFFQWRKFNFFDLTKDVEGGGIAAQLGSDNAITCVVSGRGSVVLGDLEGRVHRISSRHWDLTTFQGWEGKVEALVLPRLAPVPYLLGLGLEGSVRCLKVWRLDAKDKAGGPGPELIRISRLQRSGCPAEPSLLAVGDNMQLLAIGYDDGAIMLHRGDITRERGTKVKMILEPGPLLASIAFKVAETGVFLYTATAQDVILINVTTKDRESKSVLDTLGCVSGDLCVAPLNMPETHFATGQPDAVYCYNAEGRGQCYAFEGAKRLLSWYRGYLSVVSEEGSEKATVTVFDVQNKFIAFSAPIKPVMGVVAEWGTILMITQEKDTQVKLSMLFKKNFYDVAIKIAKNQQVDSDGLVDIFRQYGDHLYCKGDTAGAIEQYVKTIGSLEPSYVIQKFLDAQKIHQLTAYLQALHRKGLASEDHTTLLLNCYTKLKDSAKLDEFIMTKDREVDFDVDIAITVCRQAGYHRHAMALASKHGNHDLYLAILVEEEEDQEAALKYISSLPLVDALLHARKYGPGLMHQCPEDTTELLKRLCVEGMGEGLNVMVNDFIPLFISNCDSMVDFLGHLASSLPPTSLNAAVLSTLLEYRLYSWQRSVEPRERKEKERELMELLMQEKEGERDESNQQALILCQRAGFTPGLLHLYQQAGLYDQILSHHLGVGNWEAGLQACRRFGPSRPQLWVTALQQVAACGAEVPPAQFREVLDQVERHKLLSPLQVVSTLSSCPTATLGVVRDYLLRTIDLEEKSIAEDRKVIEQYQQQSKEVRARIDRLNGQVTVFQSTKCSACSQELELPTVHFLCLHGYHQHCFQSYSESDSECPACYKENKKILDMVKSQEAGRNQHDQFHAQLEKAEDGFGLVAEYFGRGLFSSPLPVPAPSAPSQYMAVPQLVANIPQSEARLRLEARGGQGIMTEPTEARLRAEARGSSKPMQSEARLRVEERGGGGREKSPGSEARLRAEEKGSTVREISEGRMRADARGGGGPVPVPSEGRLRATGQGGNSITQNLSQSPAPRLGPMPPAFQVPRREDIQASNPFGSPSNPFGSPDSGESTGEGNPFASSPKTKVSSKGAGASGPNPFGDDDDEYDSSGKNPFAD